MNPMMLQTDRDVFKGVVQACSWATASAPAILSYSQYEAIKRLADAGDELAKEWLPRVRSAKPAS